MGKLDSPRQVVLVSSREEVNIMGKMVLKDDLAAVSWHMPCSLSPMIYAIAIKSDDFSLKVIRKANSFVVNFMPFSKKSEVKFCSIHSGQHLDKFKESGLEKEDAEKIDSVRVKGSTAFLECELIREILIGDHIILIGRVVHSDVKNFEKRIFQLDDPNSFTTTIV